MSTNVFDFGALLTATTAVSTGADDTTPFVQQAPRRVDGVRALMAPMWQHVCWPRAWTGRLTITPIELAHAGR